MYLLLTPLHTHRTCAQRKILRYTTKHLKNPYMWCNGYGRSLSCGRVKPKTMKLVFVVSPLRIVIGIMCLCESTCLPVDCCFSELAQ